MSQRLWQFGMPVLIKGLLVFIMQSFVSCVWKHALTKSVSIKNCNWVVLYKWKKQTYWHLYNFTKLKWCRQLRYLPTKARSQHNCHIQKHFWWLVYIGIHGINTVFTITFEISCIIWWWAKTTFHINMNLYLTFIRDGIGSCVSTKIALYNCLHISFLLTTCGICV